MLGVVLESRPFRPFKSSDEYLYAMKEDLAEWFQVLYPHLRICTENFMDKLETGVALCEHANAVKAQAIEYVQKKQAKMMTKSVTGSLAQAQTMVNILDVKFFSTAKRETFFARDNLSNFICWCRTLQILECLLFESDDLIMRKNEKHVILCLLEVARIGAKFGMLAPMLIQMERQIDREIAADQRKMEISMSEGLENENGVDEEETDSEIEDEQPMLMYGPLPQIVTNDLKSLDEMVRDLVEKCTCPTQFPMIRVSEGKYRIGDTKVLIFVRILRNHVMVRVGGGWDTLSHYLDKHDPCRCRSQHRTTQGARLVNRIGAQDLAGAQVYYDRSGNAQHGTPNGTPHSSPNKSSLLGPPMNSINRSRSRSPSYGGGHDRRSVSPFVQRKSLVPPQNRSRSPTPSFVSTHTTKLSSPKKVPMPITRDGPHSLPTLQNGKQKNVTHIQIPVDTKVTMKTEAVLQVSGDSNTDHSDNASEVSDEGYRSLGVLPDKTKNRASIYSQNSAEDAEDTERQYSIDYEDETNDSGLRKTQFSSIIYGENNLKPTEKIVSRQSSIEPTPTIKETEKIRSRRNSMEQSGERKPSIDRSLTNLDKRKNSVERTQIDSPKHIPTKLPASPKKTPMKSANNTWNGRQKSTRPSINTETYIDPFNRSSPTRRSVSVSKYDHNGRRMSHSAATSPTKGSLKEELIEAMKNADDNETILVKEVEKLLKQYGSMNMLNDKADDRASRRRKDSKPENTNSRIPAPVFNKV